MALVTYYRVIAVCNYTIHTKNNVPGCVVKDSKVVEDKVDRALEWAP
jgi:hypothetical protein